MKIKELLMGISIIVSLIAVFVEFPLSIFVELRSSFGAMESGGFFRLRFYLSGVVIAVCGLNLLVNKGHWVKLHTPLLYALLLGYMGLVVIWHSAEIGYRGSQGEDAISAVSFHFPLFYRCLAFALIGAHLVHLKKYRSILFFGFVLSALTILLYVDMATLRINISDYVEGAKIGNYQFIGDAFAITCFCVIAFYPNAVFRFLVFSGAAAILFFVGSRSAFVMFLISGISYAVLVLRARYIPVFGLLGCLVGVVVLTMDVSRLQDLNPRMVGVFTDLEGDNSVAGRQELAEFGWKQIEKSPLFGDFGGYREIAGQSWNGYMHNFVSYWQQFGILPFLLLVSLYVSFGSLCLRNHRFSGSAEYTLVVMICAFLVYSSIISRSFAFAHLHILFGLLFAFGAMGKYGLEGLQPGAVVRKRRKRKRRRRNLAPDSAP